MRTAPIPSRRVLAAVAVAAIVCAGMISPQTGRAVAPD